MDSDPRLITPRDRGGLGMTAQWDDDIHHAIHAAVSGERQGCYSDFGSVATIPATRLLAYTLTHDQVGNRACGDRPSQNLTFGQLAVKAPLALGSPYTAMLFMGEEWARSTRANTAGYAACIGS